MDENGACKHFLLYGLISFQTAVARKACLQISSMSQVQAELRLLHIQNLQSRGSAGLRLTASCPSHESVWSMWLNIVHCHDCPLPLLQSDNVTLHIPRCAGASSSLLKEDKGRWTRIRHSNHKWMRRTLVRTFYYMDWSHSRRQLQEKLACKSRQWVKCKQSWDFCTFRIYKVEALRDLGSLLAAPAMSQYEHSSLPWLPTPFVAER